MRMGNRFDWRINDAVLLAGLAGNELVRYTRQQKVTLR